MLTEIFSAVVTLGINNFIAGDQVHSPDIQGSSIFNLKFLNILSPGLIFSTLIIDVGSTAKSSVPAANVLLVASTSLKYANVPPHKCDPQCRRCYSHTQLLFDTHTNLLFPFLFFLSFFITNGWFDYSSNGLIIKTSNFAVYS